MNYLVLINKENLIKDSYYKYAKLINCKNVLGNTIKIEEKTYDAYLKLKDYLKTVDIIVGIDTAYRSFLEQQEIFNNYSLKYGNAYTKNYVAPVKASEHHTGLAIDLAVIINDKINIDPEDLFANENVFLEIHKYLHRYGFILRYPKGKKHITGYNYEPWHIRYVGKEAATYIYNNTLTLEEYLLKDK